MDELDLDTLLTELTHSSDAVAVARLSKLGANGDARTVAPLVSVATDLRVSPRVVASAWEAVGAIAKRRGLPGAQRLGASADGEVEVRVPRIGDETLGVVVRIDVSVGDRVEPGTVLLELESDKATIEIPAELHGSVVAILVAVGDTVAVGSPLARLAHT